MAKKTVLVSDKSGKEIEEGKGAKVRITFNDARKGVRELDLTDDEAIQLGDALWLAADGDRRARAEPTARG